MHNYDRRAAPRDARCQLASGGCTQKEEASRHQGHTRHRKDLACCKRCEPPIFIGHRATPGVRQARRRNLEIEWTPTRRRTRRRGGAADGRLLPWECRRRGQGRGNEQGGEPRAQHVARCTSRAQRNESPLERDDPQRLSSLARQKALVVACPLTLFRTDRLPARLTPCFFPLLLDTCCYCCAAPSPPLRAASLYRRIARPPVAVVGLVASVSGRPATSASHSWSESEPLCSAVCGQRSAVCGLPPTAALPCPALPCLSRNRNRTEPLFCFSTSRGDGPRIPVYGSPLLKAHESRPPSIVKPSAARAQRQRAALSSIVLPEASWALWLSRSMPRLLRH
ncbi:hypothetical protein ANO11243_053790 [Dothideomycetidae sp. 11243]|nr:hypothetical protein ANO11243_053790 [fungal sp. No.11243]